MAESYGFQKIWNLKNNQFFYIKIVFLKTLIRKKDDSFIYVFTNIITKINKNDFFKILIVRCVISSFFFEF